MTKTASIITYGRNGGKSCDSPGFETSVTANCTDSPQCPKFCTVSDWIVTQHTDAEGWSSCTKKDCGWGTKRRTRTVTEVSMPEAGFMCPALVETKACSERDCPVNCVLSDWVDDPAGCSQSCSDGYTNGTKTRTRTVMSPALNDGICGATKQTIACNTHRCPIDCVPGVFGD